MNVPEGQSTHERAVSPSAAAQVEAILLVSPQPVPLSALISATALPEADIRVAIGGLKERYSPESSGIVFREVAGGFQLATNPICADVLERFRKEARPAPLSGAAYEVLACLLDLTEDFLLATGAKGRDDFPSLGALVDPEEIERVRKRVRGQGQKISGGG